MMPAYLEDNSSSQRSLTSRKDRTSNLFRRSKPAGGTKRVSRVLEQETAVHLQQHGTVQNIDTGNETRQSEEEEEEMSNEEIGREERHFHNLDHVLSRRLRECS